jgi:hypothetical protein
MHRRLPFVLGLLVLLVGALGVAPAAANHSWGDYHWARTANPFTLKVGDNVSATWDGHLDTAIADWDQSSVLNLTEVTGQARNKQCRPTSGRIEVCNGSYGFNGWLGVATIWLNGGHIVQATTKVNDSYFNTSTYNFPWKRQHVICQEVGHDFGLGHQDESGADLGTCMDYDRALDNEHPNAHDYEQLELIYAHLDSFNSYTGAESAGLAGSDAAPARVERTDRIASSTIVEHFGDGSKRVTHVTWALEGPGRPK